MCLIYCSIKIGRCQEINLVPRVPSYPSLSPSLSLRRTGRRGPWERGCVRDILGSLGKSGTWACIVKKYTQDVISYGSEGLWEGIKETIVFVLEALTPVYIVLLFLKISLTEAAVKFQNKPPKIVTQKNPPLNRPSEYKPPGGVVLGICPRIQSKTKQKW